ncbi:MAG: L,D-transpeptidase family protein [Desulfohalobiaceae bacterium]|nr:L,D-transpeptidase family protein [Desulfohalobiaceae bacterium]
MILVSVTSGFPPGSRGAAGLPAKKDRVAQRKDPQPQIIGTPRRHVVKDGETLLDIARLYDLGFNEIQGLYPGLDPWIPPAGTELTIPSLWVIPGERRKGIVVNVAELRLYFFPGKKKAVRTFPVGIGRRDWPSPLGTFMVGEKRANPRWYIPRSLQEKYGLKTMPPGPDNPLGNYWIGLANTSYGIHGTDIPWSVGRLVTHGCIRLYPEDIEPLFAMVQPGTPVAIIYEPVKIGLKSGRVYAEVHRDIYDRIEDFVEYGRQRLRAAGLINRVDLAKFGRVLARQSGMVVDVTRPDPPEPVYSGKRPLAGN